MRRRKYLTIAASGVTVTTAGCFGDGEGEPSNENESDGGEESGGNDGEANENDGDEEGDEEGDEDSDDSPSEFDTPRDIVVQNDDDTDYTFTVELTHEDGEEFEDEVSVDANSTTSLENVIEKTGKYDFTVKATGLFGTFGELDLDGDAQNVYVQIEDTEAQVTEGEDS